jgi:hypothetical protein
MVTDDFVQQQKGIAESILPTVFGQLVIQTNEPFIQTIYDLSVPKMAFGRVCILGDAAFVPRPHTAAGLSKATTNAVALAIKIAKRAKMTCKGICIRHKAQKPVGTGRYSTGQKRCQMCELFLRWEGLWCPCCGYRLRTRPRNLKYKAKLRAKKDIEEYQLLLQQGQKQQF